MIVNKRVVELLYCRKLNTLKLYSSAVFLFNARKTLPEKSVTFFSGRLHKRVSKKIVTESDLNKLNSLLSTRECGKAIMRTTTSSVD